MGVPTLKSPFPVGDRVLAKCVSFRPTALAGCLSVTDVQTNIRRTDKATVTYIATDQSL